MQVESDCVATQMQRGSFLALMQKTVRPAMQALCMVLQLTPGPAWQLHAAMHCDVECTDKAQLYITSSCCQSGIPDNGMV